MLKAVNTKILVAILAVLSAIGATLIHIHDTNQAAAASAAKAAAILQLQKDDADAAKKHDEELWKGIREQRKKNNVNPTGGSKPWTTYVP
ncbi:hypothetical protein [Granulicella tundricola]|uniref:Uncharacterized protein n=1 Tax=Granulicella tundricola (strain ATCC BAA-1859 / DSM 23138 / MP5ACTX9) TaxID=1198114 RepID=E8X7G0_GRATM|nr:hypothetical protein [Granulicella tundricola]ADW71394.1 hypothetical protein AciX9_4448 [Granulicella tundricola MP5ACTX9]